MCWGGWFLDAKLDYWWSVNDLPEFILVAVSSAELACACNRQKEYTVTEYSTAKHEPFVRYITEVVKVEVDTKFRTKPGREHTFTLGASLGGLFAFILSLSRSDVFSGCVCLSPAFWFVDRSNMSIYSMIPTRGDHDVPCQIYVDSGDGEGDNKEVVRYMSEVLKREDGKMDKISSTSWSTVVTENHMVSPTVKGCGEKG